MTVQQLFDDSDSDGSGMIDEKEFKGLIKRLEQTAGGEKVGDVSVVAVVMDATWVVSFDLVACN